MTRSHILFWAGLAAGAGAAALAGAAAMGGVAPQAVADFFTLYPKHGHGALYPPPDIWHFAARWTLLSGGAAAVFLAAGLTFAARRIAPAAASLSARPRRAALVIAALVAFHVVWFAGQMMASFAAFQINYDKKFAGHSMSEKIRLLIGDYPDRWGAIAAQSPPEARLLRHTRTDVTFLPAFVSPRLVFVYAGEEFSPVPPAALREAWLRANGITHVLLSVPWEPGGPIVMKSLEEFLRERGARTDSTQRVD